MVDMGQTKYVFGPVPSRRLGMSLGINNVPYKTCTYSCVYCQLGRTTNLIVERKPYSVPERVVDEIGSIVDTQARIDYITFVPDGEPTLDKNLGLTAAMIRDRMDLPLALLTNGSLIWMGDVCEELKLFDVVSLKIDGLNGMWRRINRPHPKLSIDLIVDAMVDFSKTYPGKILTETMLIHNLNTTSNVLSEIISIIERIDPYRVYISVPIRPPAERWVKPPTEEELLIAYKIFADKLGENRVEVLSTPEPPEFHPPKDPVEYILSIVAVHPLRMEYAIDILQRYVDEPQKLIEDLVKAGKIRLVEYQNTVFLVRRIPRKQ